jgi:hypothetical protein
MIETNDVSSSETNAIKQELVFLFDNNKNIL